MQGPTLRDIGDTGRPEPALSKFEEERREALASVLQSLTTEDRDPDRRAACFRLLRHLTGPACGAELPYNPYRVLAFSRRTIRASSEARAREISPSRIIPVRAMARACRPARAATQPDSSQPISLL